jgi:predicted permease
MRWIMKIRLRVRSLLQRNRVDHELDAELRDHLERQIDYNVARGMSLSDARFAALRELGPIELRKEECRDARGLALIDSLRQDLSYALRAFRKSPGFTSVAMLSLAIAIGANTTIFTLVNSVLLTPLPYPGADRIVVFHEHKLNSAEPLHVHPVNFVEWRKRARSFEALALVQTPPLNVMGQDGAEQLSRMLATPELFRVFGVRPVLGREFNKDESLPKNGGDVVILGYGFWMRWFGGDSAVLGRQLPTRDGSLTIIGVAPPRFRVGTVEPEAFTPLAIDPANPASTGSRAFECYGRLARGVSLTAAQAEMTALESGLRQEYQFDNEMGVFVFDLHGFLVREARPALRLLMAVVAVVLAIACVNLAGLLMARGIARRPEFAVRVALGAGRGRLVRQLVIESLVLSFAGGVAGVAGAYWATRALVARSAGALADATAIPIYLDGRVLLFTVAVATATALAFGLLPAWQASHIDPQSVLREQTRRATAGRRQFRIRELLVVSEVALAVVLLVGAGLLLRSLSSLVKVKLGYQPAGVLTMGLFLGVQPPEVRSALLDRILDRVERVPGVKAAGTIQFLPLRGLNCGTGFWLGEQGSRDPSRALFTECSLVSRGYFAAMGIPVVEGRTFDRQDRMGGPRVVIVNQAFVKLYLPDRRTLGRKIIVQWSDDVPSEIVGVVGDVHHNGLMSEPQPTVFLLHAQVPGYITNLVVRTTTDPIAERQAIIRAIQEVDPTQGVSNVGLIEQDVAKVLARPRLEASLVTSFAVIAVVLALIGIYGLIAYVVRLRTHEIGIRLALGATREQIFIELFAKGMQLVMIGLVAGLVTTVALRRIAATFVFGITAGDSVTYVAATLTFFVVAFAAIGIPARRAARVEPITALHLE